MASIKTITKFLCEEYNIPYDEAILKIYNDKNETCFQIVRDEKTQTARDLRVMLEKSETVVTPQSRENNDVDEEHFDPKDFIEEFENDEGNTVFRCMKCHKEYKKLGKSAFKHVKTCINST